jgi:hypothetical protein
MESTLQKSSRILSVVPLFKLEAEAEEETRETFFFNITFIY